MSSERSRSPWWTPTLLAAGVGMIAAAALALGRGQASPGVTLAAYTTSLSGRTRNQAANIRVAAERVDGVTLRPGEVFSFARAVGPVSVESGFVRGLAIRDGEPANEDGGGICQVVSTIYNAALRANLRIVERRKHLWPVHSVPPGLDATFAAGNVDLKFANILSQTIRVRVLAEGSRLTARIVGERPEASKVDVIRSLKAVLPPERVLETTPILKRGQRKMINRGRPGYEVEVWREVRRGTDLRRERVSFDRYAPVNEIVWVGTR